LPRGSSTSLRFARNDNDCNRTDKWLAVRLSAHSGMKIGRGKKLGDQRPRGDVEKTFPARDVPVAVELLRRDVFNHGQMFGTRAQVLTYRQDFAADLTQIVHGLKKFGLL